MKNTVKTETRLLKLVVLFFMFMLAFVGIVFSQNAMIDNNSEIDFRTKLPVTKSMWESDILPRTDFEANNLNLNNGPELITKSMWSKNMDMGHSNPLASPTFKLRLNLGRKKS